MIEFIILITAGKSFYQLAIDHNKQKWVYGILGPVTYFISALFFGLILGFLNEMFSWNIDFGNKILMTLIALPICGASTYLLYRILKMKWEKEQKKDDKIIQNIGVNDSN